MFKTLIGFLLGMGLLLVSCNPSTGVSSISLSPVSASIGVGSTQTFTAIAKDASGKDLNPQPSLTWVSSNPAVATISNGVATALTTGVTTITAKVGNVTSNSATLTVSPAIASIVISPTSASIDIGATQQFTATAKDASGNNLSPQPSLNWTSSNTSVATVQNGLATGVASGSTTVTASSGNINSNSAALSVNAPISFQASGGTYNIGAATLGTVLVFKMVKSDGSNITGVNISVSGPAGWNANNPINFTNFTFTSGIPSFQFNSGIAPVNGVYNLTASVGGKSYPTSFTITSNQTALPLSTGLSVGSASPTEVNTSWATNAAAASYLAAVVNISNGLFRGTVRTAATSATISPSQALSSGLQYDFRLYALSANLSGANPTLPAQVNASRQIVKFTPIGGTTESISGTLSVAPVGNGLSFANLEPGSFVPGQVIVKFRQGLSLQSLQASGANLERIQALGIEGAALYRTAAGATLESINALNRRSDVEYAQPNFIHKADQPTLVPNDTSYPLQWHYPAINLPQAWALENGSSNPVTVAVVDSGAFAAHPDFSGKLLPGYDFISDAADAGDGDGRDANPEDTNVAASGAHGIHVAGTVAAATNNATGVAGVSWGAKIVPVRVLAGNGTDADILEGLLWAAGVNIPSVPTNQNPAQVINMSISGGLCYQDPFRQDVFNQVLAQGTILVVSGGNTTSVTDRCNAAIKVGASNSNTVRSSYSSFGPRIDVMAPGGSTLISLNGQNNGGGVLSTIKNSSGQAAYSFFQGTSMAAPHVAGVVALMKSARPSLSAAEALDILERTARPFNATQCTGEAGRDNNGNPVPPPTLSAADCGAGLIDAFAAVQAAKAAPTPGFAVRPEASGIGVGIGSSKTVTVNLDRWGGFSDTANLSVQGLPSGVTASFSSNPATSSSGLQFTAAANTLPGIYDLTISATAGGQTRNALFTLVVSVLPGNLSLSGTKMTAYLWDGRDVVTALSKTITLGNSGSSAPYTISGLVAGDYLVDAWVDVNQNNRFDAADYYGVYRVNNQNSLVRPPASNINLEVFSNIKLQSLSQGLRQPLDLQPAPSPEESHTDQP